jgi:hypothetical protein
MADARGAVKSLPAHGQRAPRAVHAECCRAGARWRSLSSGGDRVLAGPENLLRSGEPLPAYLQSP